MVAYGLIGSLPSISEQKQWVNDFIVDFDLFSSMPSVATQPFADNIAQYMDILPQKEDIMDEQLFKQIENAPILPAFYRLVGHGKNPNAMDMLKKQLSFDFRDSIESQCNVLQLKQKEILALKNCENKISNFSLDNN